MWAERELKNTWLNIKRFLNPILSRCQAILKSRSGFRARIKSNLRHAWMTQFRLQNDLRHCLLDTFKLTQGLLRILSIPCRNSTLNNKASKNLKGCPSTVSQGAHSRQSILGLWLLSNGMNPTRFTENPQVVWLFFVGVFFSFRYLYYEIIARLD